MTTVGEVHTFRGPVSTADLGTTLLHEHVFVRDHELEVNLPDPEWDPAAMVAAAVDGLRRAHALGVRSVVDLTVPGLGRDVALVAQVAARSPVHLLASTGWYAPSALPVTFGVRGPGLLIDGPDPLDALFVRDIEQGIAGTGVRAAMLKIVLDRAGATPDVLRVLAAAAAAHRRTGVPVTVHTDPATHRGREALELLGRHGVDPSRVILGHSGDSEDVDELRALLDSGATIGMDRFGMEHVLPDDRRVRTVLALLRLGYADRMVLSQDAAFYSRVTPPSWRRAHAPHWHLENLPRRVLPMLRAGGATEEDLHQMLVANPARLLATAPVAAGARTGPAAREEER
ncbi:phosphotriesterase-related protein [Cellulomonas humilata]|uniref:Phosphotriesterase-related protein n=1 Tax=Cellulomonas humilata TaxID=144055 RepID=A0A7Y5ZXB0_9CELL|nr:phosphotriesterase-related protein [Cellulomonas humilata]NUU15779.1 phosphotriesterase-related protein [Cellulomonas humilata]